MTTHCLLKRFDLIADASGNIPLLRRFVIDLAVRGKLVKKEEVDESATEILRRIEAKKEQLVKEGKIKKQRPLPPIGRGDVPAAYSAQGVFDRLANIATLEKGLTGIQSAKPGDYPMVVTAEARSSCDHFDFEGCSAIIPMVSSSGHGDASLKRLHYQEGKFALGNILCAVFPISEDLISARFLYEYLTAFKEELLVSKMIGTANVSLTIGKIGEVAVPIITPTVQRRVYDLMQLCDRLEVAQAERERRRSLLVAASLHGLNNGENVDESRENARFHLEHLQHLTTSPEHISHLRQSILNLAVRGRLVPQDTSDEPSAELLRRIQAEKARLVNDGVIKKEKPAETVRSDSTPFEIPKNWKWTRLGELTELITKGSSPKWQGVQYVSKEDGILFITSENVGNYCLRKMDEPKYVEKRFNSIEPRSTLRRGDILINIVGASIGRTAVYNLNDEANINQAVALIRLLKGKSNECAGFLLHYLNSPSAVQLMLASRVVTAQPNMSLTDAREFPVPLPPLQEQLRIVAKVDELMALCDQLEAQLITAQAESNRLLEAVLHEAISAANAPIHAGGRQANV